MAVIRCRAGPADCRLCDQTVTIYHWDGADTVTRRVIEKGVFLDFKKVQDVSKTGSREVNGFLLVIPCSEVPVAVGDKVLHDTTKRSVPYTNASRFRFKNHEL